jgi:hypothetical protein
MSTKTNIALWVEVAPNVRREPRAGRSRVSPECQFFYCASFLGTRLARE